MAAPTALKSIECAHLHPDDVGAAHALLAKVFSTGEPPAIGMGLTAADFDPFLRSLFRQATADGLTMIARDIQNRQLAGVLLTDDFAVPANLTPGAFSPKFLPILAMLECLDDEYRQGRSIPQGQYLHLFMLAVDERYAGKGIAQQLVAACLANGRKRGYTHAVTEATGVVSQHVFRKSGFAERVRLPYADYQYQGKAVFASIRDHDAAILMDREIN